MEEEKERGKEREKEKENDETEDFGQAVEGAALSCQEGSSKGDPDLPIMHWEALSLRIAELEKQEEERREKLKSAGRAKQGSVSDGWVEERDGGSWWEDVEADRSCRITALTSRFHNQKNLQLCFINDSESEDEEDEKEEGGGKGQREGVFCGHGPSKQTPPLVTADGGGRTRGLKLEVRATLSALRDKLWTEQEEERLACQGVEVKRKKLELRDLQTLNLLQLDSLRASLNQAVHDLSSELVNRLLTRDQLRTEQDAMLMDVEDMTSL